MSRVQLALNVGDIDAAVDHYRRLFATEPTKRKPGYANFAIADPPLKLVLFENPEAPATLNHLGTEMASSTEVAATAARLGDDGIAATMSEGEICCHALQDKAWTTDPDGLPWELYTVLDDVDETTEADTTVEACCADGAEACS